MNRFFTKILSAILLAILVFSTTSVYASEFIWSNYDETILTNANTGETGNFLNLESESAVLIEQSTGQVLYDHNMHEQLRPASVTKVMTLLLIMESLDKGEISLDTKIPCTENASKMGGSQIWLDVREELTVHEMLKAICVVSANDCTVAMAEYLAGSEEQFVVRMNEKAKQLGMNDTTFKNCHGIDEDGHVTSSFDIALMSRELLTKHPTITNYTTIWMDSLRDGKSELVNTNKLIRNYQGITGLKTGSTSLALFNLSASATRDDLSLIAVIMKGPTGQIRFNEAKKLLDYGFSNYSYKKLGEKGDTVKNIVVEKGIQDSVEAIFETEAGVLIKKGQEKSITQEINIPDKISAPIYNGQKVGEVVFKLDNQELGKIDIVVKKEIKKVGFMNNSNYMIEKWFNLMR